MPSMTTETHHPKWGADLEAETLKWQGEEATWTLWLTSREQERLIKAPWPVAGTAITAPDYVDLSDPERSQLWEWATANGIPRREAPARPCCG